MVSVIFFGIVGGLICSLVTYQYGVVAAFLAYVLGGAMSALIPGTINLLVNKASAYFSVCTKLSEDINVTRAQGQPGKNV